MPNPLRIGQIGIAHNHAEGKMLAVRKHPQLFTVTGFSEENEVVLAQRGGLDCYKGLKRMTESEIIQNSDVVLVETEVHNLTKTATECIRMGRHVHIDKPASGSVEAFEALLTMAKSKKLAVQLGYMYRYNPAIRKCMELIRSGALGEIYQIDAEMSTCHSDRYRKWLGGFKGGNMYIFGSHLVDLVVWILGEPKQVHPFIKQTGYNGVYSHDNCFAVLEYEKAVAKLTTLSTEVNGWGMRRFAVMGSEGTVEIKPIELQVEMTYSLRSFAVNPYSDIKKKIEVDDVPSQNRYDEMIRDLYNSCINAGKSEYSYDHDLAVKRTLYRITGEN